MLLLTNEVNGYFCEDCLGDFDISVSCRRSSFSKDNEDSRSVSFTYEFEVGAFSFFQWANYYYGSLGELMVVRFFWMGLQRGFCALLRDHCRIIDASHDASWVE